MTVARLFARFGSVAGLHPYTVLVKVPLALGTTTIVAVAVAPHAAKVVELRFFGGLSVEETAACMEISPATVKRQWSFARAWLYRAMG